MSFSGFKEKLLASLKGLSKKKYLFYFLIMIIILTTLWLGKKDFTLTISFAVIFLVIIFGDLIFDLLGYFKDTEETKKAPIAKKILGYIIGTIIFALIIAMFLRIFDALF